jgi:polysaccharide biosynthesis protein PelE
MDNLLYFANFSKYVNIMLPQKTLLWWVVIHAVVSIGASLLFFFTLKKESRSSNVAFVFGFLFLLVFLLPIVGILLAGTLVVIDRFFQKTKKDNIFRLSSSPVFESTAKATENSASAIGGMKFKITNSQAPSANRFQALNILHSMPLKVSVPILKQILTDKTDDIRLFAYGMLDKQEKAINNEIHRILSSLKEQNEEDPEVRAYLYKQLSENYWNLVYYGMLQGELMAYALSQAAGAIQQAVELKGSDADFWMLKGKILMKQAKYDEAKIAFRVLEAFGIASAKTAPYMAEIAFMERKYKDVASLLSNSKSFENIPSMMPVVEYWTRVNENNMRQINAN